MPGRARFGPSDERGFSLIELLVAMTVFGVVLVGLTGALISAVRSIGDQRLRTAATRVATDHLETLRGLPFEELDAEAGQRTTTTPDGRSFTVETSVTPIDAATGAASTSGRVKEITAVVSWMSGDVGRDVSYTTAVAAPQTRSAPEQAIGSITMFPSPLTTDAVGRPLENVDVTVPLGGFPVGALVNLSWSNADGTAGATTLTSSTGLNWRGTIAKEQVVADIGADGRGELQFTVSAGSLATLYTLSLQRAASSPPAITAAAIDRSPVIVARAPGGRTCDAANQCQNTTDVIFTATVDGLDQTQDSVVLQYQLHDSTFAEAALAPVAGVTGQWRLTVRQKTTKFRTGSARLFRFTAIRSADGATAAATVSRDVVST